MRVSSSLDHAVSNAMSRLGLLPCPRAMFTRVVHSEPQLWWPEFERNLNFDQGYSRRTIVSYDALKGPLRLTVDHVITPTFVLIKRQTLSTPTIFSSNHPSAMSLVQNNGHTKDQKRQNLKQCKMTEFWSPYNKSIMPNNEENETRDTTRTARKWKKQP